ncbi:hypothetical protein AMS68_004003 [Peltaster fructicola]|uniref:PA14 domain-containing protein n=1 Tax=Peltaster fructicola TaxID=286661 RepID=A0A6H0XUX8_9PEZI|nr:hypothetical protein AMS68_004003 [Peltaster fructicola]
MSTAPHSSASLASSTRSSDIGSGFVTSITVGTSGTEPSLPAVDTNAATSSSSEVAGLILTSLQASVPLSDVSVAAHTSLISKAVSSSQPSSGSSVESNSLVTYTASPVESSPATILTAGLDESSPTTTATAQSASIALSMPSEVSMITTTASAGSLLSQSDNTMTSGPQGDSVLPTESASTSRVLTTTSMSLDTSGFSTFYLSSSISAAITISTVAATGSGKGYFIVVTPVARFVRTIRGSESFTTTIATTTDLSGSTYYVVEVPYSSSDYGASLVGGSGSLPTTVSTIFPADNDTFSPYYVVQTPTTTPSVSLLAVEISSAARFESTFDTPSTVVQSTDSAALAVPSAISSPLLTSTNPVSSLVTTSYGDELSSITPDTILVVSQSGASAFTSDSVNIAAGVKSTSRSADVSYPTSALIIPTDSVEASTSRAMSTSVVVPLATASLLMPADSVSSSAMTTVSSTSAETYSATSSSLAPTDAKGSSLPSVSVVAPPVASAITSSSLTSTIYTDSSLLSVSMSTSINDHVATSPSTSPADSMSSISAKMSTNAFFAMGSSTISTEAVSSMQITASTTADASYVTDSSTLPAVGSTIQTRSTMDVIGAATSYAAISIVVISSTQVFSSTPAASSIQTDSLFTSSLTMSSLSIAASESVLGSANTQDHGASTSTRLATHIVISSTGVKANTMTSTASTTASLDSTSATSSSLAIVTSSEFSSSGVSSPSTMASMTFPRMAVTSTDDLSTQSASSTIIAQPTSITTLTSYSMYNGATPSTTTVTADGTATVMIYNPSPVPVTVMYTFVTAAYSGDAVDQAAKVYRTDPLTGPTVGITIYTFSSGAPSLPVNNYATLTTYTGTQASTTTLVQASTGADGTGTILKTYPSCDSSCGNYGARYAQYDNPFTDVGSDGYDTFNVSYFKTAQPYQTGNTTYIGFFSQALCGISCGGDTDQIVVYDGDPQSIDATAIDHTFFLCAPISGYYTFNGIYADDYTGMWTLSNAISGWTRANENIEQTYRYSYDDAPPESFTLFLTQGYYFPVRIMWGNRDGTGELNVRITAPDGGLMLSTPNTDPRISDAPPGYMSPNIMRSACDGSTPEWPSWSAET